MEEAPGDHVMIEPMTEEDNTKDNDDNDKDDGNYKDNGDDSDNLIIDPSNYLEQRLIGQNTLHRIVVNLNLSLLCLTQA